MDCPVIAWKSPWRAGRQIVAGHCRRRTAMPKQVQHDDDDMFDGIAPDRS
jgi:hypothetical protein